MKFINGMANISIKSAKLISFGGIFSIMEQFDSKLSSVIDSTLGIRNSTFGYQYSEIIRSLMSVYFCGGSCIEDVTTHLMSHLSCIRHSGPVARIPSSGQSGSLPLRTSPIRPHRAGPTT